MPQLESSTNLPTASGRSHATEIAPPQRVKTCAAPPSGDRVRMVVADGFAPCDGANRRSVVLAFRRGQAGNTLQHTRHQ